ncbi:MAG: TolC family protein [Myxococcaceae bacterium]
MNAAWVIIIWTGMAVAPDGTSPSSRLVTLSEALAHAERHQPALRQASANAEAADARANQARAPLLPQLTGQLTYQRTTANFAARPGIVPLSGSSAATFRAFNFFNASVTASQLVYDFGQTWGQFHAAAASASAERHNREAALLQARQDVRLAFFAARAQKELVAVSRANLDNAERHVDQIQGFVDIGTRPRIDLAQVRTERANGRAQLIAAENAYLVAKARLNQAMGLEQDTAFDVADDSMPPVVDEDENTAKLLERAYAARPELQAQAQRVLAQDAQIAAARGGYFPSLGISTTLSDVGTSFAASAWNWNAQAQLSWSLFDGLGTPARTAEAHATRVAAEAQLQTQRLQVRLELEQQHGAVRSAREALLAAQEAEASASERLTLAEGRYKTGAGSIIELGDSQAAFNSAAAQRVQAEYTLASSRASLLRALGLP